jgi:excisionase family DNA binding protein
MDLSAERLGPSPAAFDYQGAVSAHRKLYTCSEVADLLGVGVDWVRRKTQAREVEHIRLGRNVRFTEQQVEILIAKYTMKPIKTSTARTRL